MSDYSKIAGVVEFWKSVVNQANDLAVQIKASREKPEVAVDSVLTSSDDEQVAKWREADNKIAEQIKTAQERREANRAKIREYAVSLLPTSQEGFNADAAKEEFVSLRGQATNMRNTLEGIVGKDNMQDLMDSFGIVEVVSLGRNSTGNAAKGATGIRRPRLASATVDGDDVTPATFTNIAARISKAHGAVDGDVVRDAAFKAAGTNDLSSLDPGTVINFSVIVGQNNVQVSVVTKGKPSATESDDSGNEGEPAAE